VREMREDRAMRTSPAKLIVAALIATVFGFAGAASHTCSDEPFDAAQGPTGPAHAPSYGTPTARR
jgi:hypothetical protein